MKNKFYLTITLLLFTWAAAHSQQPPDPFYLQQLFNLSWYNWGFNLEAADINRDGNIDMVLGNADTTLVFYGGSGILDITPDIKYKGRCLAVCDYNGDSLKDLITMEFVSLDSSLGFWDVNLLFYYGGDTSQTAIDTIVDYRVPFPKLVRSDYYLGSRNVHYGDFNGDGKSDIAISYPQYEDFNTGSDGIIYICMGSDIPSDTISYQVGGTPNDLIRRKFYSSYGLFFQVGNINKDGYDDLLISERQLDSQAHDDSIHILYIFYGKPNFAFFADSESVKYESLYMTGWFEYDFSITDVNDDGYCDLVVGSSIITGGGKNTKIHYGNSNGVDTIPSFILTDPDTNRHDYGGNGGLFNIGDFNNDGYNDFIAAGGYLTLHLGGPRLSNYNIYGITGLAGIFGYPDKAVPVGDQNGDGIDDFAVCELNYIFDLDEYYGYLVIYAGDGEVHTDVNQIKTPLPNNFVLFQNFPNPFNPSTVIGYQLSVTGKVTLKIFDLLGKEITTLINQQQTGGKYEIEFNAEQYKLSSGIYFYQLMLTTSEGEYKSEKKMMIIK